LTEGKLYRQDSNRKPAGVALPSVATSSIAKWVKLAVKTYNRKLIPFAPQMRREMTKAERPKPVSANSPSCAVF
jgi:hypothetical protein